MYLTCKNSVKQKCHNCKVFHNNHEMCFKKERRNRLKQESFKVNMCNKYT